jgi:hypothetical protein
MKRSQAAGALGMSKHRKAGVSGRHNVEKQQAARDVNRESAARRSWRERQRNGFFGSVRALFDAWRRGAA